MAALTVDNAFVIRSDKTADFFKEANRPTNNEFLKKCVASAKAIKRSNKRNDHKG